MWKIVLTIGNRPSTYLLSGDHKLEVPEAKSSYKLQSLSTIQLEDKTNG